ncbi:hypothetical protein S40285_05000 [Stachybotrys chlorohalonatus IBT 40285]|uniref:Succinate dehydrogenase assembly factor 4, mitochondrial n=1 Tax=Stachybotrys chlorohalonatus (strain IBT 40285) TaxID=1283841 RepID=A0A084QRX8_STAC4|nr:hypothetical protein S40285_05000 [Stachybotrys chlorohalonata IBT 40285]
MSRLLRRSALRAPRLPTIRLSSTFRPQPSPLKLSAADQAEFERLQRAAALAPAFQPENLAKSAAEVKTAKDDDTTVNRGMFRGAPPEFEGDTNPKTGEVGGPKNEPLRWGGAGDWSYNGRVTDF